MTKEELLQALAPYLKNRQGQIWILLLAAIIILVLVTFVWESVDSVGMLVSGSQKAENNAPETVLVNQPVLKTITEKPLFGQGELPGQINTHYQLAGVLYTPDAKQRKAIIGSPTRSPEIYTVGEQLKEGGKLYQVNENHVLLLRNGQIEKLYLLWEGGPATKSKSITPDTTNNADEDASTPPLPDANADSPDMGDNAGVPPDVNAWRERIKELQQKYQGRMVPNSQTDSGDAPISPLPMKMRGRFGRD